MPQIKFIEIRDWLNDRYKFRFNTVGLDLEMTEKGENDFKTINEHKLNCLLFETGFTGFDKQVTSLMKNPDYVPEFDPIKEYFEGLDEWDKKTDWIGSLALYVDTTDNAFFVQQFKKALVRMAAQGLGLLAFNKQCLTFYGKQNDGKSYFLRNLCPKKLQNYLKDNPDFEGKDSKRGLAENFMLNIDELSGLARTEVNRVKAMFAESSIKTRLPYDRKDSIMQRRASFVASTNEREFLVDTTGNVRWLVFEILGIKHDNGGPNGYMSVDIDQVWSQAYSLLLSGFEYQMSKEEMAHSENNNVKYGKDSMEYELLITHFEKADQAECDFYQPKDLVVFFFDIYGSGVRINKEQVGKALQKMKVEKVSHRAQNRTVPVYGYWLKIIEASKPIKPYNRGEMVRV